MNMLSFCLWLPLLVQDLDPGVQPDLQYWPEPSFANARVLLIGVDDYLYGTSKNEPNTNGLYDLNGAEKDVNDFANLMDELRAHYQSLKHLGELEVQALKGTQVTRKGIETAIEHLRSDLPTGLFFILWAGHGLLGPPAAPKTGDTAAGVVPYLLLQDSDPHRLAETALPFEDFLSLVNDARIDAKHRVIVMDVCHSGALLTRMQEALGNQNGSLSMLLAASYATVSQEDAFGGLLSQGLLHGFRGYGKGPQDGNLTISLQDAFSHARAEIELLKPGQRPSITSSDNTFPLIDWGDACTYYRRDLIDISAPDKHRSNRPLNIEVTWRDASALDRWDLHVWLELPQGRHAPFLDFRNQSQVSGTFQLAPFQLGPGPLSFHLTMAMVPKNATETTSSLGLNFFNCRQMVRVY